MSSRLFRIGFVLMVAIAGGVLPAWAQEPTPIDTHRDWHTYKFEENGKLVCYMATQPTKEEGDYTQRGDVYLMVTHRPAENSRDVVSVITGYTYGPDSDVEVDIGDSKFSLFTAENTAWADDEATDREMIAAMRAGSSMTVKGVSNRGTVTTDTYSLLGFTAAHNEITRVCGI